MQTVKIHRDLFLQMSREMCKWINGTRTLNESPNISAEGALFTQILRFSVKCTKWETTYNEHSFLDIFWLFCNWLGKRKIKMKALKISSEFHFYCKKKKKLADHTHTPQTWSLEYFKCFRLQKEKHLPFFFRNSSFSSALNLRIHQLMWNVQHAVCQNEQTMLPLLVPEK